MFDAPLGSSGGTAFAAARDRTGCRVAHAETALAAAGTPSAVASDPERAMRDERSKKKKFGKENVPRRVSFPPAGVDATFRPITAEPSTRGRPVDVTFKPTVSIGIDPNAASHEHAPRRTTKRSYLGGSLDMSDFDVGKVVGAGTFGRVAVALHRRTGTPVAIKTMSKSEVLRARQAEHVLAEHAVLETVCGDASNVSGYEKNDDVSDAFSFSDASETSVFEDAAHPFLVRFLGSAQDARHVRFVLEYVPGGELFSHLRRLGRFDEPSARFYATEIVLALEYLHDRQIAFRDLKPENVLLDADGHVKLTDFGFAKALPQRSSYDDEEEGETTTRDARKRKQTHELERTYTLCGTPEYLAPEIVTGKGHGPEVDWWALGVLVFEMLAGYPPFHVGGNEHERKVSSCGDLESDGTPTLVSPTSPMSEDDGDGSFDSFDAFDAGAEEDASRAETYRRIVRASPVFPAHFSLDAERLIARLLEKDPARRAGGRRFFFPEHDGLYGLWGESPGKAVSFGGAAASARWFQGVDWRAVVRRELAAPVVPFLRDALCTSQYDAHAEDQEPLPHPFELTEEEQAVFADI
jgi:serine/threonine protein kinase